VGANLDLAGGEWGFCRLLPPPPSSSLMALLLRLSVPLDWMLSFSFVSVCGFCLFAQTESSPESELQ
jgi:hypothetical protein